MKPDAAIWRHLLRTGCLGADECLYVDDVLEYCRAAETLGFHVICYTKGSTDLLAEMRAHLRG